MTARPAEPRRTADAATTAAPVAPGAHSPCVDAPVVVVLDNRKAPCAVGLIRAAQKISELDPGTVLEVWSRDRFAPVEIPLWAEREGHLLLTRRTAGWWPRQYYMFAVQRT